MAGRQQFRFGHAARRSRHCLLVIRKQTTAGRSTRPLVTPAAIICSRFEKTNALRTFASLDTSKMSLSGIGTCRAWGPKLRPLNAEIVLREIYRLASMVLADPAVMTAAGEDFNEPLYRLRSQFGEGELVYRLLSSANSNRTQIDHAVEHRAQMSGRGFHPTEWQRALGRERARSCFDARDQAVLSRQRHRLSLEAAAAHTPMPTAAG